jgi:hypothetical protein
VKGPWFVVAFGFEVMVSFGRARRVLGIFVCIDFNIYEWLIRCGWVI